MLRKGKATHEKEGREKHLMLCLSTVMSNTTHCWRNMQRSMRHCWNNMCHYQGNIGTKHRKLTTFTLYEETLKIQP